MSWVFGSLAVLLGIVLLWGTVAPRSQWRVLAGWSTPHPYADEPSGAAYAVRRIVSAAGVVGVIAVLAAGSSALLPREAGNALPLPLVEQMWGTPPPRLVDRVITPIAAPPPGLVEFPVLGYQDLTDGVPDYLRDLRPFTLLGDAAVPGYIGEEVDEGTTATGTADLIVHVRGPVLCIPRDAVAIETETAVQIAVYYGLPVAADGTAPDSVAGCAPDAALTGSVLIPLVLAAPLGEREVQGLDGAPLESVPLLD